MDEKYRKVAMFVLFAIVIISSLGMFMFLGRFFGFGGGLDNAVTVPVSGPVMIGEKEASFAPQSPLRISRASSKILLRSAAIRDVDLSRGTVFLSDGSTRKVTVSLRDASGKEYPLVMISIGSSVGFGFPDDTLAILDRNTSFQTVHVRSDAPISLDAIEWYSWTGK